jgi:hypothetical protein
MNKMSILNSVLAVLVCGYGTRMDAAAEQLPLVYTDENTGAACPAPKVPAMGEAKAYAMLPDPFAKADGSGRIKKFSEWSCRRAEIKAQIEGIEIGPKPPRPKDITATYSNGTLTVKVTAANGKSLTLTSKITLPSGTGPFPAIIGFDSPSGSLPATVFSSRNIAQIPFSTRQVTVDGQKSASDPFFQLYPDLTSNGQYSAWCWGVSRLIDGLELAKAQLPIDTRRLAVSGCSRWGKGALFAGAFDERIALTLPQESGGGGVPAWRVSETLGKVETLGATDHNWFMESMFKWSGANVPKLPHDHHVLAAMVAPRALFVIGNGALDYEWLAEQSAYVSSRAAEEVFKAMGIPDRFGFSHSGHTHCAFPDNQTAELSAFVDKFLLGKTGNTTGISTNPFAAVDYDKWISAWRGQSLTPDATGLEGTRMGKTGIRILVDPFGSEAILAAKGPFTYRMLNTLGRPVESGSGTGAVAIAHSAPPGVYLLKVTIDGASHGVRFTKP